MPATWTNIFAGAPTVDGVYWIVRLPYFDTPVQASYTFPDALFQWTDSNGNLIDILFNEVFKWRDL